MYIHERYWSFPFVKKFFRFKLQWPYKMIWVLISPLHPENVCVKLMLFLHCMSDKFYHWSILAWRFTFVHFLKITNIIYLIGIAIFWFFIYFDTLYFQYFLCIIQVVKFVHINLFIVFSYYFINVWVLR